MKFWSNITRSSLKMLWDINVINIINLDVRMKVKREFDSANWVAGTHCATTTNGRLYATVTRGKNLLISHPNTFYFNPPVTSTLNESAGLTNNRHSASSPSLYQIRNFYFPQFYAHLAEKFFEILLLCYRK